MTGYERANLPRTLAFEVLLYKLTYYGVTDTVFDLMKSY